MVKKVSRRGKPSHEDLMKRANRPQPLTGDPEGVRFRLLRPVDERADVEHYWARGAFYDALRSYAPKAYRELVHPATSLLAERPSNEVGPLDWGGSRFARFITNLEGELSRWRRNYAFFVDGEGQPRQDRAPGWLSADIYQSFFLWHPEEGPFPLRAFWRNRWDPVTDEFQYPEPDPMQDDVQFPEPVLDANATGQLVAPNPDSVEMRALLRVELVRTEVDASGAIVPVVRSPAEVRNELLRQFMAHVDLQLSGALERAAERGIRKPGEARLQTIMRRYVLKQFCWCDSRDIAAGETRGDDACTTDSTDEERDAHKLSSRRRDVDDDIKSAVDLLGVPVRTFPVGPEPKRSLSKRRT